MPDDAFTDRVFGGNAALVCLLPYWLEDQKLLAITRENNLPATAFLVKKGSDYAIRWFTPAEVDLCGHGSIAAAYVIFNELEKQLNEIRLHSSSGILLVKKDEDFITLDFPQKSGEPKPIDDLLRQGLNTEPEAVFQYQKERCIVILRRQSDVENLRPDMSMLKGYECRGIVATAPGEKVDFVSRTFYPHKLISEDPVTGISHCMLAPYWAKRLGKNTLVAYQASERGGYLKCEISGNRVLLKAKAVLYLRGSISL